MKFRYKKYGPGVLRPVIPIEVVLNGLEVPYKSRWTGIYTHLTRVCNSR